MDKVEIELRKQHVTDSVKTLRLAENTAQYFAGEAWAQVKVVEANLAFLHALDALTELFEDGPVQIGNGNTQVNNFGSLSEQSAPRCTGAPCFSSVEHFDDCPNAPVVR